jgi:hypothetical protein
MNVGLAIANLVTRIIRFCNYYEDVLIKKERA